MDVYAQANVTARQFCLVNCERINPIQVVYTAKKTFFMLENKSETQAETVADNDTKENICE